MLPPGTFDRLVEVIIHLKDSGIYPHALDEELTAGEAGERPKLADVAAVYRAYEQALMELPTVDEPHRGAVDLEGIYRVIARETSQEAFDKAFRELFPDVQMVSLAGFDEFSVPELGVIARLLLLPGISMTMMFDFQKGNPELFGHLEQNYQQLIDLGFQEVVDPALMVPAAFFFGSSTRPETVRRTAERLSRHLFSRRAPEPPDPNTSVSILPARNRKQEVEIICKKIRTLVAARPGRDLQGICVAFRHPQLYTDLVREEFARHGIPANITDRYALSRSPVVVALLGLLKVSSHGYRSEDVLRVVTSPYFKFPGSPPFDAPNLAAVAVEARIVAGLDSWKRRIDARIREAADDTAWTGEDRGATERANLQRRCRKALADVEKLAALLEPFARPLTASEFGVAFEDLVGKLRIAPAIVERRLERDTASAERDMAALRVLRETVSDIASLAALREGGDQPAPLRNHLERLRLAVRRERYNIREQAGRGVLVTSIEETRELPVEVMIVAGLVDGEFPSPYQPEIFLSARRRADREQRYSWENRYLFYQAVTNWSEELCLTYPLRDGTRELVRSTFVDAFLQVILPAGWASPGEIPFASMITSPDEYFRWYVASSVASGSPLPHADEALHKEGERVLFAAEVERSRTVDHSLGRFEGRVGTSAHEPVLAHLRSWKSREFSASQLDTYAECPFRFLSSAVMRLRELPEADEELSPMDRGTLLHAVLFEYFLRRREAARPPLFSLPDESFAVEVEELIAVARANLDRLDVSDVFWEIDKEMIVGSPEGNAGLLQRFLLRERERRDGLVPSYFEVSFGGMRDRRAADPLLSREHPVAFGSLHLRGRIDRIELGGGFFTVVDYKTGSSRPTTEEVTTGQKIQLAAYLVAGEELLRSAGMNLSAGGAYYYDLKANVRRDPALVREDVLRDSFPRARKLVQESEMRDAIANAIAAAEKSVEALCAGEFPLTTKEPSKVCPHCPYDSMCRINAFRHQSPIDAELV
jgi:ATP-dependent helicase/nuclease subunit B